MAPPRADYLTFTGRSWIRSYSQSFDVLCGDTAPYVTDGYAIWQTVNRPLQQGVTIFQGNNPPQLTCNVRFGVWDGTGWDDGTASADSVETDIGKLEWMAGGNFLSGRSPVVRVTSKQPNGGISDLIPRYYHGIAWIVTGMQWGQAWRNSSGSRIYAECQVTLTKYVGYTTPPGGTTNGTATTPSNTQGAFVLSSPSADTPITIANGSNSTSVDSTIPGYNEALAANIIADPHNANLQLRSIRQQIKHGNRVFVPSTVVNTAQVTNS